LKCASESWKANRRLKTPKPLPIGTPATRSPTPPKKEKESPIADRDLYSGLIRLHVLRHATEQPIFGLGMIEELNQHGYRISREAFIPCCMASKRRAIFARPTNGMENPYARSTGQLPWGGRRSTPPRAKYGSCFRNSSWKANRGLRKSVSTFATLTTLPSIYTILQGSALFASPSLNPLDPVRRYYEVR
jgi:hypothetical protein